MDTALQAHTGHTGHVSRMVVIGVGDAGNHVVNYLVNHPVAGVVCVNANTDLHALRNSLAPKKVQLGLSGLGTYGRPALAKSAVVQSERALHYAMVEANMVIVTAGLGGGTGTGAAPEIIRIAKNLGLFTVGVITLPFAFEGNNRLNIAWAGLLELQKHADAVVCINNENFLLKFTEDDITLDDVFQCIYGAIKNVISSLMVRGIAANTTPDAQVY